MSQYVAVHTSTVLPTMLQHDIVQHFNRTGLCISRSQGRPIRLQLYSHACPGAAPWLELTE